MSQRGWIGVDLDGTLALYDGWQGHTVIGPPVALMVARVQAWVAMGREVRIVTARVSSLVPEEERREALQSIGEWSIEHIGTLLAATAEKDFAMAELWDDRAVTVEENTGISLHPKKR